MNNEDIEILEELIQIYKDCSVNDYPEMVVDFSMSLREIKALEHLINRNKKLEKAMDEDLGNIINLGILLSEHAEKPKDINIYIDEAQTFLNTLNYYYISKDKIKEKIKDLRKKTANVVTDEVNEIIINVLQELLEEEN